MKSVASWQGKIALAVAIVVVALGVTGCFQADASTSQSMPDSGGQNAQNQPAASAPQAQPPANVQPPTQVQPAEQAQPPAQPAVQPQDQPPVVPAATQPPAPQQAVPQQPAPEQPQQQAATPTRRPTVGAQQPSSQQATLFAQATLIIAQATQTVAAEQTLQATALGTFAAPGQPTARQPGQVQPTQPGQPQLVQVTATPVPSADAQPGASGQINQSCIYTVADGDLLFRIALRFGLTPETVARANGMVNMELLSIDQKLRIPSPGCKAVLPPTPTPLPTLTPLPPTPVPPTGQPTQVPPPSEPVVATLASAPGTLVLIVTATPVPVGGAVQPAQPGQPAATGRAYTVAPGDTLFGISVRFGVPINTIAQANNLSNINLIYIGQRLIIP